MSGRLRGAAYVLVVAMLASRVLGFLRDQYIAAAFGANGATDAFNAAFTIPDLLGYFLAGGALSITFIPIYTRYLASDRADEGDRVFSTIATIVTVVLGLGTIALWFATPRLAGWYLHRLAPENVALAIGLSRILLPAQIALCIGGLASATLMARQRFVAAAFAPLVYNLGTILGGVLLGSRLGVAGLAWGTLAGAFIGPFGIQLVSAMRAGLSFRPQLALTHPDVKLWFKLSIPLMVGVSLVTADEWIMRYFAGSVEGTISHLSYARKLVWVPIAVAGQAVGQASMPFFARLFAEGKRAELAALLEKAARGSAVVAALAAGALGAVAVPTVDLLFRHGRFTALSVGPTAMYVMIFAIAIPLWGMQGIIARAFYAAGDTFTPMAAGTLVTVIMVPVYAGLHRVFGAPGLVIASDLGILCHTLALFVLLPRRMPEVDRQRLVLGTLRGILVAVLAAIPAHLCARYLPVGHFDGHALDIARMAVGGLVFSAVALAIAGPLGVPEAKLIVTKIRARFSLG